MAKSAPLQRTAVLEAIFRDKYPNILASRFVECYSYKELKTIYSAKKPQNHNTYAAIIKTTGWIFKRKAGLWRCIEYKKGKWKWLYVGVHHDSYTIKAKYEANKNTNCFTDQYRKDLEALTPLRHSHENLDILSQISHSGSGRVITDSERSLLYATSQKAVNNWAIEKHIHISSRTSFSNYPTVIPYRAKLTHLSGYVVSGTPGFQLSGRFLVRIVIDNVVQVESHQITVVDNKVFFSKTFRQPLLIPYNSLLNVSVTNEGSNAVACNLVVTMFMEEHDE